jgi:acyl-CoA synthetase (AMP-forming)/AMP-acid ligase II
MSPNTHLNTSFMVRIFGGRTAVRINNLFLRLPGVKLMVRSLLRLLGTKRAGKLITRLFYLLTRATSTKGKSIKRKKKNPEKRGTIGVPFPDTEVKFLDVESGSEISIDKMLAGARGELLLKGPQRMLGYWPESGTGVDDEGYIHTSDVVKLDENGYFYIVDRTKDMIIVSGFKVYSREVDDLLYTNSKVELAATVGVPDPEREGSERIVVFVQPKLKYISKLKEKEILDFLKKRVARYAVPKMVRIISDMPLTEVQKIDKKVLREMAEEEYRTKGGKKKKKVKKERKASTDLKN